MLKVLEIIQKSTDYLEQKGIESPRINVELLLAEVLNCNRMDLYLQFDKPLDESEIAQMRKFLTRRANFEPLQYITGKVNFCGNDFLVDKNVLIPRPETELLVEEVIAKVEDKSLKILDIGTGSGVIPITISKNCPNSQFVAIDISEEAINKALENAELNKTNGTIDFKSIDINDLDKTKELGQFDIIISNPPYISPEEYIELQKEIVEFEPRNALTDEKNGYYFYELISKHTKFMLKSGGLLVFEMGMGQSEKIKEFMKSAGLTNISIVDDLQSIPRVIFGEKV